MGKIEFISTVEYLNDLEECRPKPAKYFIPEWFKAIPSTAPSTVKVCPSFPDFFSQGYIVPMWSDTKLNINDDGWNWHSSGDDFSWEIHGKQQFIDYTTPYFNGVKGEMVFKAICPWRVITPPGWSVLQLPLFYHFNEKWSILPGVIDTDIHSEINQQVLIHKKNEDIILKRGEPFALYIPFKRKDKLKLEVRHQTENDKKIFGKQKFVLNTVYSPSGMYRKLQRIRDKSE